MKEVITSALGDLVEWVKQVGGFLNAEIPMFAKEIINYGIWSNFLVFVIAIILALVFNFLAFKLKKYAYSDEGVSEFIIGSVFLWVFSSISIIVSVGCLFEGIKAIIAPRLFLIENVLRLIK